VIAQAADDAVIAIAQLSHRRIEAAWSAAPAQAHRRPDVYASWVESLGGVR
jgi:hypothetical protein